MNGVKLSLEEIKQIEVEILSYVAGICEEHKLRYYLSYGTLIGAIRHQGFIPWDDDIDIAMPRDDYNKLLYLLSGTNNRFECLEPLKDGYFYEFAKVIDATTIVRDTHIDNSRCGVWIDIFPLDGLIKTDRISHFQLMLFNRCRAASVNACFPHKTSGIAVPIEYCFWKLCRIIGYRPFLKWSLTIAQKHRFDDCEYVGFASSYPARGKYMKKEWFADSVDVEFEGHFFKAPVGYHKYLTTQYGCYMQLPSEDKRVSHQIEAYKTI